MQILLYIGCIQKNGVSDQILYEFDLVSIHSVGSSNYLFVFSSIKKL